MTQSVDFEAVEKAARILSEGGLVAIPTETVYGLAADADNREAVLATYAAKGRPADHPSGPSTFRPKPGYSSRPIGPAPSRSFSTRANAAAPS